MPSTMSLSAPGLDANGDKVSFDFLGGAHVDIDGEIDEIDPDKEMKFIVRHIRPGLVIVHRLSFPGR